MKRSRRDFVRFTRRPTPKRIDPQQLEFARARLLNVLWKCIDRLEATFQSASATLNAKTDARASGPGATVSPPIPDGQKAPEDRARVCAGRTDSLETAQTGPE